MAFFLHKIRPQYEENVCNRGGYYNFMHLKKISRELRRQLFGRSKRRRSHSPSRSPSPKREFNYGDRLHGGCDSGRRGDHHSHDRSRRPRSRSPGRRGGQGRSPVGRRNRSPVREGSAERRALIEQWNRERDNAYSNRSYNGSPGGTRKRSPIREGSAERRAMIEQWNREREQADSAKQNSDNVDDIGTENGGRRTEDSSHNDYQQQHEDGNSSH